MIDPQIAMYLQAVIPAGMNSAEINGDEFNGAGVNEPVWPDLFETSDVFNPIMLDADMMAFFDEDCPDLVARGEHSVYQVPAELETWVVR